MPRKTLLLIVGLVLVTIVLFVIALRTNTKQPTVPVTNQTAEVSEQPTPTSVAHSVLTLSPNPLMVAPGQKGSVDVTIDTAENAVTAIQLEFAYDPNVISNVKVTPGPLFQQPVVLIDKNDAAAGRYTYAFGIQPNQATVQGAGNVALVTFTAKGSLGQQSQLALLPTTLVTARGVANSVLKSESGTLITIGNAGNTIEAGQATQPISR